MERIKKIFLTKTIPDFLDKEFDMPYIKFVFNEETLKELSDSLIVEMQNNYNNYDKVDNKIYIKGLKSILYLWKNRLEYQNGSDDIFIHVNDSSSFFSYLQELIALYSKRSNSALMNPDNFIRSIWLRMGTTDIENVEIFLRRQIAFIKNESIIDEYKEFASLNDEDVLAYRINENKDWSETNKNIVFSIRRSRLNSSPGNFFDFDFLLTQKDYDFPAIYFGLVRENERNTCYLYGIHEVNHSIKYEEIKQFIQPVRKKLRNKYVSADFLIALSLFFDFLYKNGVTNVIVPTLQVFNYQFHENLSKFLKEQLNSFSDEEKNKMKNVYAKYIDRQDDISYSKTERLIYTIMELVDRYPTLSFSSYPFMESKNIHITITGEINLLSIYPKQKRNFL